MHSSSSPPPLLQQVPTTRDPRESPWYPYDNGSGFDANIAMILLFLFCALVCTVALNAAIRLFRRGSARHHLPETAPAAGKPPNGSSLPVASPPPSMVYSAGMKLAGAAAECAICLSEFVNGEGVRVLPRCKHGFHVKCIEGWLSSHTSCPTCRSCCLAPSPERSASPVPINSETVVHIESSQLETSPTQDQRSETE